MENRTTPNMTGIQFWLWTVVDSIIFAFYILYLFIEAFYRLLRPKSFKSLEGEVILLTGAANGIGREIAFQLAQSRAKLVCWDILKRENEETVQSLRRLGCEAFAYQIDVSDRHQVASVADRVRREVGDVTVIINNAGIGTCEKFLNFTAENIEKTFQINVFAHFWILRQFLPKMVQTNKGHIVTVCSIGGLKGNRYMVPYHGSKFAVHGYLESLKDELAHMKGCGDNIKFTTIYPTAVKTRLINGIRFAFRFPSFTPFLDPKFVASKVIEGLQTETEKIHIPAYMPFYFFMECFLPVKAQRALTDFLLFDFCPDSRMVHYESESNGNYTSSGHVPRTLTNGMARMDG